MVSQRSQTDDGLAQSAIELRHDVEVLAQRCQQLYEEANELVVRLRELMARTADFQREPPARHDPIRGSSSPAGGDGRHAPSPPSAS